MTTRTKKRPLPTIEVAAIEEAIDLPFDRWATQCHSVSLAIVKSGVLGEPCRVARGFCQGVGSQHSWVVLGMDCYHPEAVIVDATLWSYDDRVKGIWVGRASNRRHFPHGMGSIWEYGQPAPPVGPVIELTPKTPLSPAARAWLKMAAPHGLDRRGWGVLAHAPVGEWPAAEIIAAMDDTEAVAALVPIDVLGMITTRNPNGLYLP